jgi:zinc protease
VLKEINMVTDDSRLHQWILFQKTLFEKHPAKNPTYGTVDAVKNFSREDVVNYYSTHYIPNNMIISVVGNVSNVKENVEKYFGSLKPGKAIKRSYVDEPLQTKAKKFVEKKKTLNSYMVLGYKTVPWKHKDSYVFDVISAVLGRGQSGWMFNEIRNKRGLAYQVGVNVEDEYDYGTFAVYAGLDKKKITKAKEIMLQQFKRLQKLAKKDLDEAKTYIEGNHTLQMEDNFQQTDNLSVWESLGDVKLAGTYLSNIRKVTVNDVKRVAKKYFNDKYTLVVIEQE